MSDNACISCRRPKGSTTCQLCNEPLCKDCLQFIEIGTFSFLESGTKKVPEELNHTHYCSGCYCNTVEPALESYRETMEQAKGVYFFTNNQKARIPLLKRAKDRIRVEACDDRDEAILRLAFQAVEQGYNAVLEGEVICKKVRNEAYQTSVWQGVGVPALVDAERMERHSNDD